MYTDFYSLKEKPFDPEHSSRFRYSGKLHREALSVLAYGVEERKGITLLTGEAGTGKTTLVQTFVSTLGENVRVVHLSDPPASFQELMEKMTPSLFGTEVSFSSKASFLIELEALLKEFLREGRTFLLVVDEAHRLSLRLLEEIRLLSNIETNEEKLINILLVGEPGLIKLLNEPELRPLRQRVSVRAHIEPLDLKETEEYIGARLKAAGAKKVRKIFPRTSIEAIYSHTEGYPKRINDLAEKALQAGYERSRKKITPDIIAGCALEHLFEVPLEGENAWKPTPLASQGSSGSSLWRPLKMTAVVISVVVIAFLLGMKGKEFLGSVSDRIPALKEETGRLVNVALSWFDRESRVESRESRVRKAEEGSGGREEAGVESRESGVGKTEEEAGIQTAEEKTRGQEASRAGSRGSEVRKAEDETGVREESGVLSLESGVRKTEEGSRVESRESRVRKTEEGSGVGSREPGVQKTIDAAGIQKESRGQIVKRGLGDSNEVRLHELMKSAVTVGEKSSETVQVREGDTMSKIALKIYGQVDERILELLKRSNPQLTDINRLSVGQEIHFPSLSQPQPLQIYTVHIAFLPSRSAARELVQGLAEQGYEAYLLPYSDPEKGTLYRVTLENFVDLAQAQLFAESLSKKGLFDHAKPVRMEVK